MPIWRRSSPNAGQETPAETLERIGVDPVGADVSAEEARSSGHASLQVQRGGYGKAEVDRFLATVTGRTTDEVRTVIFKLSRRKPGYSEDAVDRLLDEIYEQKAREQPRSDPPTSL